MVWPFFLRFAPVIERSLQLVFSVFFVSEQLPVAFRGYVLWSPFAHALQLIRSCYFVSYKSQDADPAYVVVWFVALGISALICARAVRAHSQPV